MGKSVSVGIHVPSVSASGLADGQAYAAFFQDAEALGLDAIWVEDRIFHPGGPIRPKAINDTNIKSRPWFTHHKGPSIQVKRMSKFIT